MLTTTTTSTPTLITQGVVFKKNQGQYTVQINGQSLPCSLSSKLRKQLVYPLAGPADPKRKGKRVQAVKEIKAVDPIAIGDHVTLTLAGDGTGQITEVLPRRNRLGRTTMQGSHALEQVIVANVDQIVVVYVAGQIEQRRKVLDRHLAAAEAASIPAFICLTKADEAEPEAVEAEERLYRSLGYPVIVSSAVQGAGIAALRDHLRGKLSVFVGKSGVGKSSLLNALEPGLGLRAKEVNQHTGEGKHTTTHLEMFTLSFGGQVVDTPGTRKFTLWDVTADDVAYLFPEMRSRIGQCQFGLDCSHAHEPGCTIRSAVERGEIAASRYVSYQQILSRSSDD